VRDSPRRPTHPPPLISRRRGSKRKMTPVQIWHDGAGDYGLSFILRVPVILPLFPWACVAGMTFETAPSVGGSRLPHPASSLRPRVVLCLFGVRRCRLVPSNWGRPAVGVG